MGVIGMKVTAQGALLGSGRLTVQESLGYVLSLPGVSTVIVGCKKPAEVAENASLARGFAPFDPAAMRSIEARARPIAAAAAYFKKP
jgi:aryl-alcohol dehydrogenase-like predicted oxidoreductase